MKPSKPMEKKEIAFMQKKGAPKSMIAHEKAEMKAESKPSKSPFGKPAAKKVR